MRSFDEIQDLLEQYHPLPKDLVKVYVLGKTGAGKTTLIRKIMGTDKDAFPTVGNGRTTTLTTEYVLRKGENYKATLIFKTKEDILADLEDVLSNSIECFLENTQESKEKEISSIIDDLGGKHQINLPDSNIFFLMSSYMRLQMKFILNF